MAFPAEIRRLQQAGEVFDKLPRDVGIQRAGPIFEPKGEGQSIGAVHHIDQPFQIGQRGFLASALNRVDKAKAIRRHRLAFRVTVNKALCGDHSWAAVEG
jgi:hypothetical protein